jgi:hypothetical protein
MSRTMSFGQEYPVTGRIMRRRFVGCLALSLLTTACNTITRGTEETVTVTVTPAFARVWTSLGQECAKSPCIVKVDRKTEFTAYAEAKGYRSGSVLVNSVLTDQAAPGVIGNAILPAGSVGLVLDVASGAMMDHKPNPAHIELMRIGRTVAR